MSASARPFSIVLPNGKRPSSHRTLFGALTDARKCNASRSARDLPPVRILNRDTGTFFDIAGDDSALDVEVAILASGRT